MGGSSSSSGEEDGDAEWMAAINSVATTTTYTTKHLEGDDDQDEEDDETDKKPQNLKLYQIKALKILEDMLEKNIEVVTNSSPVLDKEQDPPAVDDDDGGGGVRLFKDAPLGIVFDHSVVLHGPTKRPKILPGDQLDEKSKKFRKQLQSAAVDGADIIAAAKAARQKTLAKLEAREAAAKAAAKKEEERIVELKKIRGERWLPCMAREMRANAQRQK